MNLDDTATADEIFSILRKAAHKLGFEYCAYGFRSPIPFTNPRTIMINDYPRAWCERYDSAGYVNIDPTVLHAQRSQVPIIWSDPLFENARPLWEEAKAQGLVVGWAQSMLDGAGGGGMLTLARSGEPLTATELAAKELSMRRLVGIAHGALSHVYHSCATSDLLEKLSTREIEILRWHADGKTAAEIGEILHISLDTVKFHTKNAVTKLGAANKTAAVVRAAVLGFLC
ncbi:autoinducer binding domain-containing protein [Ralstonia nicotianae]|uniref:autoinducer binding domain-containing protein n=1 Tax=Ralstonia pseudosolanacearum TaxID=1310165 RepID=UPI002004CEA1|nr:autoinducer binding domain-containing protein [Ralstonia pseudosolanacearum]